MRCRCLHLYLCGYESFQRTAERAQTIGQQTAEDDDDNEDPETTFFAFFEIFDGTIIARSIDDSSKFLAGRYLTGAIY